MALADERRAVLEPLAEAFRLPREVPPQHPVGVGQQGSDRDLPGRSGGVELRMPLPGG